MKRLLLYVLLFSFIGLGHSQIVLNEVKVDHKSLSMKIEPGTKSLTLSVPEKRIGDFERDPLAFAKENFDIHQFLLDNREYDFNLVQVNFKSRKGHLLAFYSIKGDLTSSFQKFTNVQLPDAAKLEIYRNYPGYSIVDNEHLATTKNGIVRKEFYKVKLQNGSKAKRVRLNKSRDGISLAGL